VVMGIPRPMSCCARCLFRSRDERELASMVIFKSERFPFRFEEAVIDFTLRRRLPVQARNRTRLRCLCGG